MERLKKLTFNEIIKVLEDNDISVSAFGFDDFIIDEAFKFSPELQEKVDAAEVAYDNYFNHPDCENHRFHDRDEHSKEVNDLYDIYLSTPLPLDEMRNEYLYSIGLGPIIEVEQKGGEGEGNEWYSVKHFPAHDIYIETDASYDSYHGFDFYDGYGYPVKPVEVKVIQYKAI